jgi:hypothetical protein
MSANIISLLNKFLVLFDIIIRVVRIVVVARAYTYKRNSERGKEIILYQNYKFSCKELIYIYFQ